MFSIPKRLFALVLVVFAVLLVPAMGYAGEWRLNMTEGVTSTSKDVYDLHMLIFYICCVIGALVFGVMFVSMFLHRKSRGAKAENFHESTTLELIWTVIPALILVAMAIPATSSLKKIYDTDDADIDVLITGLQWKWRYEYLGTDVSYLSSLSTPQDQIYEDAEKGEHYLLEVDNPLVIPTGKKVRFLVTAGDVIHSWWVPDLAVKRDAIPGYINEAWTKVDEPGVYRGQCAELCGKDHGFMPIEVHAVTPEEYDQFIATKQDEFAAMKAAESQTFSFEDSYAKGEEVYNTYCLACHGADGEGGVGTAMKGSEIAMGPLDAHLDIIVNGSESNPLMAAWGDQLDAASIAAVITFQRNAFGNNMGETIQPVDVVKYKQGQ